MASRDPLLELLLVRTPIILVYDIDKWWVRKHVLETVDQIGSRRVNHLILWDKVAGWGGSETLLRTGGLTSQGHGGRAKEVLPDLQRFLEWLKASQEEKGFKLSVALIEDLREEMEGAVFERILWNLASRMEDHNGSMILSSSRQLDKDHPVARLAIQIAAPQEPERRYGDFVDAILEKFEDVAHDTTKDRILEELQGLSIYKARTYLRLAALKVHAQEEKVALDRAIKYVRDTYEE